MPTNILSGSGQKGQDPLAEATSLRGSSIPQADPIDLHSEKGDDNLYHMTNLPFGQKDIQKRYEDILGPLTLFAPYSHEDVIATGSDGIEMERPVTPINEEIKHAPHIFNQLAKYVRRRITANPEVTHLTVDDQQGLASVLMGEVNGIWPDIRKQVDDPFLTPEQNKELQRRICVHIVTVCETLFHHYVEKATILNKRGVFSGPANMSRLKAQLAIDANKFLNILIIRRYLVNDMRGKLSGSTTEDDKQLQLSNRRPPTEAAETSAALTYQRLVVSSRPKDRHKQIMERTVMDEIQEMNDQMPSLPTEKLFDLISNLSRDIERASESQLSGSPQAKEATVEEEQSHEEKDDLEKTLFRRHNSMGEIDHIETLAEELDIVLKDVHQRPGSSHLVNLPSISRNKIKVDEDKTPTATQLPGINEAAEDLKRLLNRTKDTDPLTNPEEDLPPLLQAITRSAKHDGIKQVLDKQLEELKEKERKLIENLPKIKEPTHPQPATVSTKLPNKMLVRTSDIRVSERICMSSVTIDKHSTVYNDLLDEIDQATVLKLDKNLFLGDEIKEVYKEIMKRVPTDHLELENDVLVEPTADSVNLSTILMPSALAKRKTDKALNNKLQKSQIPPWDSKGVEEWTKNPASQLKELRGELHGIGSKKDEEQDILAIPGKVLTMAEYKSQLLDAPRMVQERLSRNYASWLAWWKNTVTSDDYMKFLTSQESDYMGYVFHFYDSEDEDEETVKSRKAEALTEAEQKEKEKKLEELKSIKSEFTPGVWNFNSIIMGGLGKDPEVVDDDRPTVKSPTSDDSKSTKSTKPIIARKSRLRSMEDTGISVPTKQGEGERSQLLSRTTLRSQYTAAGTETEKSPVSEPSVVTPQDRLEKVWASLQMPDSLKLDMAIKYSTDTYIHQLSSVIGAWEKATDLIMKREALMTKLENFERLASDPNRFFEKGSRRSSVARLDEAKVRSAYYKRIDVLELDIKRAVGDVKELFNDTITYQGRPYLEKMHWDRIEMLYWLQEERKQNVLEKQAIVRGLPLKVTQLEPIQTPAH